MPPLKFHTFRKNYHDGRLVGFTLGPRRELTLEIALDPVWNENACPSATVRFGGIENFDQVASYFRALPLPPNPDTSIAVILALKDAGDRSNSVVVELDGLGCIRVFARHVTEA